MMRSVIQGLLVVGLIHTARAACGIEEYNVFTDMHVVGGAFQTGISRLEDCQARCNANPECTGVDFTSANTCWVVINGLTDMTGEQGTNHYKRSRTCTTSGRDCTFEYLGRYRATGTTTTQVTIEACLESCQLSSTCLAVAYQAVTDICILLVDTADIAARTNDATYVMYGAADCTGICEVFTPFENRNGPGGILLNTIQNEAECKEACIGNLNCFGVDFGSGGCYVNQDPDVLSRLGSLPGNIFYLIDRSGCGGTTSGGGTTAAGGTTTPPGCNPSWSKTDNTHAFGGTPRAGVTTEAACLADCAADATCVGADVNRNTGSTLCWHHLNIANLANTEPEANTDLYTLIDRCPGQCNPTWTITNETHAFAGTPQSAITDPDQCLADCAADTTCMGVDLDFSGGILCWFHTAATIDNTGPAANNWNYKLLDRCPSGGTGPTGGPTTGSGTTTPGCVASWTMANDTHALGGQSRGDLTTAATCLAACVAEPTCVAVDISYGSGVLCWVHLDADNLNNVAVEVNTYHYILNSRCAGPTPSGPTGSTGAGSTTPRQGSTTPGCVAEWDVTNNTHANGGTAQPTITTAAQCLQACIDNAACVALDVDFSGNVLCWLHLSAANLDQTEPQSNTWFYRLIDRCPTSGCIPAWQVTNNTHAFNGQEFPAATTAAACWDACVQDANCVGVDVDFNAGANLCWKHFDTADFSDTEGIAGVYLYRLLDRCPTVGSTTTGEPGCIVVWTRRNDTNAFNGQPQLDITDPEVCLRDCVDNPSCAGADLDFNTGAILCWFHFSASDFNDMGNLNNAYSYELIDRCQGPGSTPRSTAPVCQPEWEVFNHTHAFNGIETTATNMADCLDSCARDTTCVGVDLDFAFNSFLCWFHRNANDFADLEALQDTYVYRLLSRCGEPVTPTPMPPTSPPGLCFADLVFVLDNSGSMADSNWNTVKNVIKDIINDFPVNRNNVRVGLVTYSNNAVVEFDLDDYGTLLDVNNAIDRVGFVGGRTNTPAGLNLANTMLQSLGGRSNVQDVVILLADGHTSMDEAFLGQAAADLQNRGARVYAIGAVPDVDYGELYRIVSNPLYVYSMNDFTNPNDYMGTGVFELCQTPPSTPGPDPTAPPTVPTTTPIPIDQCLLDIVLVVDESGSIEEDDPNNWNLIQNFLAEVVGRLDTTKVQLAAVTFGNEAVIRFNFNNGFSSKAQIQNDIRGWDYRGGNTNTTGALRVTRQEILDPVLGGNRMDVRDVIILITDGNNTREISELPNEVTRLKNIGTTIVGVGVTSRIDIAQLERIVTAPSSENFFFIENFDGLLSQIDNILQRSCFQVGR